MGALSFLAILSTKQSLVNPQSLRRLNSFDRTPWALSTDPSLLLVDEPFSALDRPLAKALRADLIELLDYEIGRASCRERV